MKNIVKRALSINEYIIEIRRELHRHPELAFEEQWTHDFLMNELKKFGLESKTLNKTGLISDIGEGGNRLALRADMDALPIQEETDVPFKSEEEGKMHACGHDTHMAMLLGAVKLFTEYPVERPLRIIFQPSEERTPGGAPGMIKEGALEGVTEIYGIHIAPDIEKGHMEIKSGPMMAATDEMDVLLRGSGGHASEPQRTQDIIYISSLFINEIQGLVSRKTNPNHPLVISICSIHGGSTYNIFPTVVKLKGTARTVNKETWQCVPQWITSLLKSLKLSHDIDYELRYTRGYPILINDARKTEKFIKVANEIMDKVKIMDYPLMGGEDFSYYLREVPGAFAFIGGGKEENLSYKLHTPNMIIDEDALHYGTALLYSIANEKTDN